MKLVVGLGALEDYEILAKAGADEVFVGFVPESYYEKYGNFLPANRREVFFYHVQLSSLEDMKILRRMEQEFRVPVSIAFNALYYLDEQMEELYEILLALKQMGFERYIISDIGFLSFLKQKKWKADIEISGEIGESNSEQIGYLLRKFGEYPGITRVIYQRKTSFTDMCAIAKNINELTQNLIDSKGNPKHNEGMEWEAFFLNENCHFSGGYCNSMHCDEMVHMCLMPYELRCKNGGQVPDCKLDKERAKQGAKQEQELEQEDGFIGETGCGLCNLWDLKQAGITHLKIVGRGLSGESVARDVKAAKKALKILDTCQTKEEYVRTMKQMIFPKGCSGQCYVIAER